MNNMESILNKDNDDEEGPFAGLRLSNKVVGALCANDVRSLADLTREVNPSGGTNWSPNIEDNIRALFNKVPLVDSHTPDKVIKAYREYLMGMYIANKPLDKDDPFSEGEPPK